MSSRAPSIAIVAAIAAGLSSTDAITHPQPRFRSGITAVSVNVSVRDRNAAVTGLTAADFVLKDNGVRQNVSDFAIEAVPIDVTLILDTSGSAATGIEQLARDAREIATLLRPDDRFRLMTIDTYVHEITPMRPVGRETAIERLTFNGASAVYDALAAGLIRRVDPDRRHLVVAMTDAVDTNSVLGASTVREVAARADAALYVVLVSFPAVPPPVPRNWVMHHDSNVDALREAAESTGGQLRNPGLMGVKLAGEFERVFEEFRQSYVLRYTPAGVSPAGWHAIDVRVPRSDRYTIRARKGYFGAR